MSLISKVKQSLLALTLAGSLWANNAQAQNCNGCVDITPLKVNTECFIPEIPVTLVGHNNKQENYKIAVIKKGEFKKQLNTLGRRVLAPTETLVDESYSPKAINTDEIENIVIHAPKHVRVGGLRSEPHDNHIDYITSTNNLFEKAYEVGDNTRIAQLNITGHCTNKQGKDCYASLKPQLVLENPEKKVIKKVIYVTKNQEPASKQEQTENKKSNNKKTVTYTYTVGAGAGIKSNATNIIQAVGNEIVGVEEHTKTLTYSVLAGFESDKVKASLEVLTNANNPLLKQESKYSSGNSVALTLDKLTELEANFSAKLANSNSLTGYFQGENTTYSGEVDARKVTVDKKNVIAGAGLSRDIRKSDDEILRMGLQGLYSQSSTATNLTEINLTGKGASVVMEYKKNNTSFGLKASYVALNGTLENNLGEKPVSENGIRIDASIKQGINDKLWVQITGRYNGATQERPGYEHKETDFSLRAGLGAKF